MNITLSIDEKTGQRARERATAMGKSLNQVVREYLHHLAGEEDTERWIEELHKLSGGGKAQGWRFNRDEIHERR